MRTNHAYMNPNLPPEARAADLLPRLTLAEKIGQMTQVEKNSIDPDDIARLGLGSILSGGGGVPEPNTAVSWRKNGGSVGATVPAGHSPALRGGCGAWAQQCLRSHHFSAQHWPGGNS